MSGLRCTVESMQYSACGMKLGDHVDITADGVEVPEGRGFCWFALASIIPLLRGRVGDDQVLDDWLATRPLLQCPDPPEALFLRLTPLQD